MNKSTNVLFNKGMSLSKYDNNDLETILERLNEMLVIPIQNSYNLSKEELKSLGQIVEGELKKRKKRTYSFDEVWDNLISYNLATESELRLVTSINGSNMESLNSVLYSRTSYRDWEQYAEMMELEW
tara:strand:- start:4285 stop:4665 length:381 start_codon:yes stop_codon:yes gene_type:complete